ncbi:agrin-like isoform X2 [Asterias amurensis]|uniref:agrin-like isoform X2 n=1 Tax=Asterias amurensis TaxID=7602 RepID=UPI003AB24281
MATSDMLIVVLLATVFLLAVAPAASQPLGGGGGTCSNEQPLEQREEIANIVLSGFVGKVMRKPRTLQYVCEIQVVRVLKGENALHHEIAPPMDMENNQVMVTGFGDPAICDSRAHVGDVRILLLGTDGGRHLKLNSSLVRITLGNLDRAQAAVSDVPYVTREPITEGPCATILCAYGSICRETSDSQAECFCPEECPDIFSPVCGDDSVTYNNNCYLRASACRLRKKIGVASSGPCDTTSLCQDKECPFGAECMVTPDGATAKCVCSQECGETEYNPVCGSDGVDYANECEMRRVSCLQRRELKLIYNGVCNPCLTANLDSDAICQLNRNRQPVAGCVFDCEGLPSDPVCASDGQIYDTECLMKRVACQSRFELFAHEESNCQAETSPCLSFQCEFGKCILDLESNPTCLCISSCPDVYVPVCGTDGVSYHSVCHLQREQCTSKRPIQVVSNGPCLNQSEGLCSTIRCGYGAMCVEVNGSPTCSCDMMCTNEDSPVCGTDKNTYGNACLLKQSACEQQKDIQVELEGLCNGCESFSCEFGAICEMSVKGPKCVCPEECVKFDSPICGSDDNVYPNECELNVQACRKQEVITVESQGDCTECEGVKCEYGSICNRGQCTCPTCANINQPVCGTNQVTYQSLCHLRAEMCNERIRIAQAFEGPCDNNEMSGSGEGNDTDVDQEGGDDKMDFSRECDEALCQYGGTCEYMPNGNSYCSCIMNCPATRLPVCGSNQVTYGSECLLREASCEQQAPIYVESQGSCEDVEMEPCDGDSPLIIPNTQEEYTCTEEGEECPSGSYCHIHPLRKFAVCCPEQTSPPSCEDGMYGCCPDGITAAQGFNEAGCPSHCDCNELGSYSPVCNPTNKQCPCKPGVGGKKCDRCEPGFWDFREIQAGNIGCRPCGCSKGGSARDDCEQMMGTCMCKHKAMGIKCNMCPKGMTMGATGCVEVVTVVDDNSNLCEQLNCRFHATCTFMDGLATCVCPSECPALFEPVCGTDGQTYGNECQMKVFACRLQRDLQVYARGICETVVMTPMTVPLECLEAEFGCCDDQETLKTNPEGEGCPLLPGMTTTKIVPTMLTTKMTSPKSSPTMASSPVTEMPPDATTIQSPPSDDPAITQPQITSQTAPRTAVMSDSTSNAIGSSESNAIGSSESKTNEASTKFNFPQSQTSTNPSQTTVRVVDETSMPTMTSGTSMTSGTTTTSGTSMTSGTTVTSGPSMTSGTSMTSKTMASHSSSPTMADTTTPPSESFPLTSLPSTPTMTTTTKTMEVRTKATTKPLTETLTTFFRTSSMDPTTVTPLSTTQMVPELTTQPPVQTTEPAPVPICERIMCLHGGTCLERETLSQGYLCICPIGWGGPVCEEAVTFMTPSLSEFSYLAFPKMRAFFSVDITLEFQTEEAEGLLLFNGQEDAENGDYISLAIVKGSVELRFDLGSSDAVVIRSTVTIQPLHWYTVRVSRDKRDGSISVDGETLVKGSSNAGSSGLTLTSDLFVGDVPQDKEAIYRVAGTTKGFVGCIGYLEVNGKTLDVYHPAGAILYGANVGECGNDPCLKQPCLNNATCTPTTAEQFTCECVEGFVGPLCGDVFVDPCEGNMCYTGATCTPLPEGGYRCDCPTGWKGDMCDREIVPEPAIPFVPGFNGNSFIELPGLSAPSRITIEVEFLATKPNGMIFYNGQSTNGNGDFISLNLVDGYLEFRYNLGSGTAEIRSPDKLSLDEWHVVEATRMKVDGMLYIDGIMVAMGESLGSAKQLNLKKSLFIGGTDNYSHLSRKAGITDGFVGGIKMFAIDREVVPDLIQAALNQVNIEAFVEHPCVGAPCMHTFMCVPDGESYTCECPPQSQIVGSKCVSMEASTSSGDDGGLQPVTERPDTNAPVSFDGRSYFSYSNTASLKIKKAQMTNIIKLRFRTTQESGLLLYNSINQANGDFIAVAVIDGSVEFGYNLGSGVKRIRAPGAVSDDRWHTVTISRAQREGSIQVDDEAPSLAASKPGASFLNTDGIMWIGGHANLQSNVPFDFRRAFVGCIADVELEENSLHLYDDAREERPSAFCGYPDA